MLSSIVSIVFYALGLCTSIFFIWRHAKAKLYDETELFDTIVLSLVAGVVCARIAYALITHQIVGFSPLALIAYWVTPGLFVPAGIIGVVLVLWSMSRRSKELQFWELVDSVGFSVWIGLIIGTFGSVIAQIDTGIASPVAGVAHPVNLYRVILLLILFFPYISYRRARSKNDWLHAKSGVVGSGITLMVFLSYFLIDFFRVRYAIWGLSDIQWFSIPVVLISFLSLYIRLERSPRKDIQFIKQRFFNSSKLP